MYFEEWEFLTEPILLSPLPLINLSGIACKGDIYEVARDSINCKFETNFLFKNASEIIEEIFHQVKSPTPPLPNMRDPETFKQYFELNNKHLGLYFTNLIMVSFFELLEDTQYRLGYTNNEGMDNDQSNSEWDGRVEYIENLI